MKKESFLGFIVNVVMVALSLLVMDRLIGAIFAKMKDIGLATNPESIWLKTPFTVESVKTDILVIGSSKASHHYVSNMLEESLGMTTYNCGQDGCFFLYQNCIMNMILDRYVPKIIIWDIQPESFVEIDKSRQYQNFRYLTPYYNKNLWAKSFVDGESRKMPYRMHSRMFGYNSMLFKYLYPIFVRTSPSCKGYIPLADDGDRYPDIMYEKEEGFTTTVDIEYLALLDSTLKRCKEKGAEVRIYISPVFSEKVKLMKDAESSICEIAIRNGVSCSNFHSAEVFMTDATLFKDASHLNENGAELYTQMVIESFKNSFPD